MAHRGYPWVPRSVDCRWPTSRVVIRVPFLGWGPAHSAKVLVARGCPVCRWRPRRRRRAPRARCATESVISSGPGQPGLPRITGPPGAPCRPGHKGVPCRRCWGYRAPTGVAVSRSGVGPPVGWDSVRCGGPSTRHSQRDASGSVQGVARVPDDMSPLAGHRDVVVTTAVPGFLDRIASAEASAGVGAAGSQRGRAYPCAAGLLIR